MPKPTCVSGRDGWQESAEPERSLGVSGAAVETVAKRPRRLFSTADKLRLVKEADACLASGERAPAASVADARGAGNRGHVRAIVAIDRLICQR